MVNDGVFPPGSAAHSQIQPSYISMGRQSIHGEEFPVDSFIPGVMYEEVFDEKVVPMHNKDPIDFNKVKDDQKTKGDQQIGGETEEEKLSQQDKAKFEIMSQYFKPETVKLLLSKNWQSRRKGLESFINEIPTSMKENGIAVQEHAINIFFNSCKEKLSQLTELAMKLFEVILEESKSCGFELKFDSNKTANMIAEVLDKKEIDIIKNKVLTGGYFDYNTIAAFILSDKSYLNKRFSNSEKHIQTRLDLILFMLETSEQNTSKRPFPMKELLEYVFNKFSHGNKSIRSQTQKVIVQIYQKFGWYALESYLSREVPQNQLQILLEDIPEVESLIKKKDTNKGSESLREALKAVKEASQSIQNIDSQPPKATDAGTNKNKKELPKQKENKKPAEVNKANNSKNVNTKKTDQGKADPKKVVDKKKK